MTDELPIVDILLPDLERTREAISACVTFFTAEDVQRAQLGFRDIRKSALTNELELVKERLDGILADYLFERYREEKEQVEPEEDESEVDPDDEDELSANPLGSPRFSTRIQESQAR